MRREDRLEHRKAVCRVLAARGLLAVLPRGREYELARPARAAIYFLSVDVCLSDRKRLEGGIVDELVEAHVFGGERLRVEQRLDRDRVPREESLLEATEREAHRVLARAQAERRS